MSSKKDTHKFVILAIVGLILAWLIGGFIGGFTGNIFFGLAMMAVIFSGVFGKKVLESTGGISIPFTLGIIIVSNTWDKWWQYLICYLLVMFIGNGLSNFRPNYQQEYNDYKNKKM